jgi:spermidine/putrescine transport system ATP-binding protein
MRANEFSAVAASGVKKKFGEFTALDGIELDVESGSFFTLLGPSGCGKTTLLRLIGGFEHVDEGSIKLFGQDIASLPANKRRVNTVFQNYALFPHLTVAENVAFGLRMLDRRKPDIERRVEEILNLVQLSELKNRKPDQLSGGQQQRVALARAIAPDPKVLLLDEPLSALDMKLRLEMRIELKQLQERTGITFIFVTHDQEEALAMSDQIAVMNKGKILQVGSPHEIYQSPEGDFVARFIGSTNILKGKAIKSKKGEIEVLISPSLSIKVAAQEKLKENQTASISIRPEQIGLEFRHAGIPTAIVERIVYLGAHCDIILRIDDVHLTAKVQNGDMERLGLEQNASVGLVILSSAPRVLVS